MTIHSLLHHDILPLRQEDTAGQALARLAEHNLQHLPVVDGEERLVGLVSEDQLLNALDHEMPMQAALSAAPVYATLEMHPFEAARLLAEHRLSILPVVEEGNHFAGLICRQDLFDLFTRMLSAHASGAVIVLEVNERDYSLGQLAYVVEQNNVKILSISTEPAPNGQVQVTLKLNVQDTSRVRHVLEHHGYHVVGSYSKDNSPEDLLMRVQEFLKYLEL